MWVEHDDSLVVSKLDPSRPPDHLVAPSAFPQPAGLAGSGIRGDATETSNLDIPSANNPPAMNGGPGAPIVQRSGSHQSTGSRAASDLKMSSRSGCPFQ